MVVKCCSCGEFLGRENTSGLCLSCSHKGKIASLWKLKRTCAKCDTPICDTNKSGLCKKHANREGAKKPRRETGGDELRLVKCHMPGCDIEFYVEWWQHPKMAYCRKCRLSEEYREPESDWLDLKSRYGKNRVVNSWLGER